MRTAAVLLVVALGSVGCGNATPEEKLQGTWINLANDGCGIGLTFEGSTMILQTICTLTNGSPADEIVGGTFTATEDTIVLSPNKTSCPTEFSRSPLALSYFWSGDTLGTRGATSATFFTRDNSSGGGGVGTIEFGCWDSPRQFFTPGPIVNL